MADYSDLIEEVAPTPVPAVQGGTDYSSLIDEVAEPEAAPPPAPTPVQASAPAQDYSSLIAEVAENPLVTDIRTHATKMAKPRMAPSISKGGMRTSAPLAPQREETLDELAGMIGAAYDVDPDISSRYADRTLKSLEASLDIRRENGQTLMEVKGEWVPFDEEALRQQIGAAASAEWQQDYRRTTHDWNKKPRKDRTNELYAFLSKWHPDAAAEAKKVHPAFGDAALDPSFLGSVGRGLQTMEGALDFIDRYEPQSAIARAGRMAVKNTATEKRITTNGLVESAMARTDRRAIRDAEQAFLKAKGWKKVGDRYFGHGERKDDGRDLMDISYYGVSDKSGVPDEMTGPEFRRVFLDELDSAATDQTLTGESDDDLFGMSPYTLRRKLGLRSYFDVFPQDTADASGAGWLQDMALATMDDSDDAIARRGAEVLSAAWSIPGQAVIAGARTMLDSPMADLVKLGIGLDTDFSDGDWADRVLEGITGIEGGDRRREPDVAARENLTRSMAAFTEMLPEGTTVGDVADTLATALGGGGFTGGLEGAGMEIGDLIDPFGLGPTNEVSPWADTAAALSIDLAVASPTTAMRKLSDLRSLNRVASKIPVDLTEHGTKVWDEFKQAVVAAANPQTPKEMREAHTAAVGQFVGVLARADMEGKAVRDVVAEVGENGVVRAVGDLTEDLGIDTALAGLVYSSNEARVTPQIAAARKRAWTATAEKAQRAARLLRGEPDSAQTFTDGMKQAMKQRFVADPLEVAGAAMIGARDAKRAMAKSVGENMRSAGMDVQIGLTSSASAYQALRRVITQQGHDAERVVHELFQVFERPEFKAAAAQLDPADYGLLTQVQEMAGHIELTPGMVDVADDFAAFATGQRSLLRALDSTFAVIEKDPKLLAMIEEHQVLSQYQRGRDIQRSAAKTPKEQARRGVATAPSGPERIASMNEAQQTYAEALFPTHYGLARREVSAELDELHIKMTNTATEADQLGLEIAQLRAATPSVGRRANLGRQGKTTPDAVEALELEASALFDEAHAAQRRADASGALSVPTAADWADVKPSGTALYRGTPGLGGDALGVDRTGLIYFSESPELASDFAGRMTSRGWKLTTGRVTKKAEPSVMKSDVRYRKLWDPADPAARSVVRGLTPEDAAALALGDYRVVEAGGTLRQIREAGYDAVKTRDPSGKGHRGAWNVGVFDAGQVESSHRMASASADAQKAADNFTRQAERKLSQAQAGVDRLAKEKGLRGAWARYQGRRKAKADHLDLIREKQRAQRRLQGEARDAQQALADLDKPLREQARVRALASAARYTAAEFNEHIDVVLARMIDDSVDFRIPESQLQNLSLYAKEGGELVLAEDVARMSALLAPEAGRAGKANNAVTRRMRELEEALDAEYSPLRGALEAAGAAKQSPWQVMQRIMSQPEDALRVEDAMYDMLGGYKAKGVDGSTPVRNVLSAIEDMTPADIFRVTDAVRVGVRKARETGRGYTPGALGQYAGLAPEYKHWEPVLAGFEEFYANALKMAQAEGMFEGWSVWDMLDRSNIAAYMHHTLTAKGATKHLSNKGLVKLEAGFEKLRTMGGGVLEVDAKGRMTLAENMVRNKALAGKYGDAYTADMVNAKQPAPGSLVVAELEMLDDSIVNFFEKDPFVTAGKYANELGEVVANRRMMTRARTIRDEIVPENVRREGLVAEAIDPVTGEVTQFPALSAGDFDKAASATGKGKLPLTVLDQLAADWGRKAFAQYGEEWSQPLVRVSGPETAAMLDGSKFQSFDKAVFDTMDDLAARGASAEDVVAEVLDKHKVTITMEMAASAGNHMYLPADLANFMRAQLRPRLTQGGGAVSRAIKVYDNVLSGFRGFVTVIWPRFFGRNALGALNQQAALMGPRGLLDPTSHHLSSVAGLWKADEAMTVKAFDGVTDIEFTNRELYDLHVNADQATMVEATRAAERELHHGTAGSFRTLVARMGPLFDVDLRGTPSEILERMKVAARDLEQGHTPLVDEFIDAVGAAVTAPAKGLKSWGGELAADYKLMRQNADHLKGPAGRALSLTAAGGAIGGFAGAAGASGMAIAGGAAAGAVAGGALGFLRQFPGEKLTQLGGEMAQMQENYFRRLAYINARRKGLSKDHAAWLTEETMFDYSVHGQSWFSYEIMRRIQPFWTFQSKNFSLWAKLLVDHPQKMAAIEATMSGLMHHDSDPEKTAGLSDYQRSRLHFFLGGGAVFAGMGTTVEAAVEMIRPGGDAAGLPGGGGLMGGMSPMLKIGAEIVANKNFFYGRPLTEVRGARDLELLPQAMQEFFGYVPGQDGRVGKVGTMTPTKPWHPDSKQAGLRLYLAKQIDLTQLVQMYNQAVGNAYVDSVGELSGGDTEVANALRMARLLLSWKPYVVSGGSEALRERGLKNFEQALFSAFRYKTEGAVLETEFGLSPSRPKQAPPQVGAGRLLPTNYPAP